MIVSSHFYLVFIYLFFSFLQGFSGPASTPHSHPQDLEGALEENSQEETSKSWALPSFPLLPLSLPSRCLLSLYHILCQVQHPGEVQGTSRGSQHLWDSHLIGQTHSGKQTDGADARKMHRIGVSQPCGCPRKKILDQRDTKCRICGVLTDHQEEQRWR